MHRKVFWLVAVSVLVGLATFSLSGVTSPCNITSVSPVEGFTSGGTALTVYGNGFEAPSEATMGLPPLVMLVEPASGTEFECTNVKFVSEWQLTCTTPAHPAAAMCVRVQLRSRGIEGSYTLCKPFSYK